MNLRRLVFLLLLLALPACDAHDPSDFEDIDADDVLTLSPDSASLIADGVSTLMLTATIVPEDADPDKRSVTFTTSAGTLLNADDDGKLIVEAGPDHKAVAILQSSTMVGTALVQAKLSDFIQQTQVHFDSVRADHMLMLTAPASVAADGKSTAVLKVVLGPSVSAANRTVKFTTTAGTFVNASGTMVDVPALYSDEEQAFIAQTKLRSIQADTAFVVASASGFAQSATVVLTRVPPAEIKVDAGGFVLKTDSTFAETTKVKALLRSRNGGIASVGTPVIFTAFDADGNIIDGFMTPTDGFRNITKSNEQGVAEATFSVGGTSYEGIVQIIASYALNLSVRGMDTIRILPMD